jgi:hypothetical protein
MPAKGWKAVTLSAEVLRKAQTFLKDENTKAGVKKYRSLAHLVELAISEYLEKRKKEEN